MRNELEVLGFWAEKNIFEKSLKQRKGSKRFVFFEGPPYANGLPGLHHVEARAFKDVMIRYKTMQGFLVERRAGWDTHGLPTEMAAEKKLGITRKRDIEEKIGIQKFVETAREDVFFYKGEWEKMTDRMGYWLDFKNAYVTLNNTYIESLWWVIKEFWNKKLFYEDYKILPWCVRCGTALSSHELAQGYKKTKDDSVYVRFPLKTRRGSLLVWTTTPWTLPANVAAAVHPDLEYVTVDDKGEKFIMLKKLADKLFPEREQQWAEKGANLVGLEYDPPFRAENVPYKVVSAKFISEDDGTGIVHIAPAFGEDDMKVGREFDLPILTTIDDEGRFTNVVPQWQGIFVKDADPLIIKDLEQKNLLWKKEVYEHDYPFCWRCDTPLLYVARRSWWVRVSKLRRELVEANKTVEWHPAHLKDGRFGQWIKDARDWAFSRERYWGAPIPVWKCEGCDRVDVFGSMKELGEHGVTSDNVYYFVRHGFAKNNQLQIGSNTVKGDQLGLTPRGVKEIKLAAKKLKKAKIDLILSSDLLRTKETTEILARELGVPVLYDEDLREVHIGDFNMKPESEIDAWEERVDRFTTPFPGDGESWDDLKKRAYRFFQRVETLHKHKRIIIVSHADTLWFLEGVMKAVLEDHKKPSGKYPKNGDINKVLAVALPRNDKGELDVHRPYIDAVAVRCTGCGSSMKRVPDVADVWFDSGAMPFAQSHYPFEHKERIDKKIAFPADYIAEAVDQTRGWFYVLLAVSVLLGKGAPYKHVLSLGHVLDTKGKKMSKSKGNVVEPNMLFEKYGADAVRWYFYTINQPEDSKLFDINDVEKTKRNFIDFLLNGLRFYEMYAHTEVIKKKRVTANVLDRWIVARVSEVRDKVTKCMDGYDIVGAARELEAFVGEDISRWYIRRSRERMKDGDGIATLRAVLLETARMCAPFVPFTSEIIYQALGGSSVSVHLETWPKKKIVSKTLTTQMQEVRRLAALGLELRARAGIKVRQPLGALIVKKTTVTDKALLSILKDELNVKAININKAQNELALLNLEITPELKAEGLAREITRILQDMRKRAELHPTDMITVDMDTEILGEFTEVVKRGARVAEFILPASLKNPLLDEEQLIDGIKTRIAIAKLEA
ncbi:MAG: class I tRNA ligase family protein [Patescibacteria group bacterium]